MTVRRAGDARIDPRRSAPDAACSRGRDERGEALPAAILFTGVLFMVLIGLHVVILAMARTAVQSAADAAVAAAQAAGPGDSECDDDPQPETARQCEGQLAASIAMAASRNSIVETRPPAVAVEEDRGVVSVIVFGGTISPVFGGLEVTAEACGPLDDVPAPELTDMAAWRC